MSNKIDFAGLTLMDALDLAILIEEEAKDRYTEFVDQMEKHHTPEAAAFFHDMIENEARHQAELTMRRHSLFHDEPSKVKSSAIWDIEAPEYDRARAFMTAHQAMQVALDCEIKAHDFFQSALPHIKDAEVRTLFEQLREEELQHQELVRREIAKLPPDSKIDPEDFVDEPTAQ